MGKMKIKDLQIPQSFPKVWGGGLMRTPKNPNKVWPTKAKKIPELEPANLETDLAKRLAHCHGVEWVRVMRTLQKRFDAKLIYHEDSNGTVGKKPSWADLD